MRISAVMLALLSCAALAQAPQKIGYQGLLLKADGSSETGTVSITFSVFAAPTGGTSLWSENQAIVLSQGYYATTLGDMTALPVSLFDGSDRYLELSVNAAPLSPRMRMVSVPYAIAAGTATNVIGGVVNGSQVQVGGATVIDSTGSLSGTAAYLAGAGIAITGRTISMRGCAAGEILRYSGAPANQWQCATIAPSSSDAGVLAYTADLNGGLQLMAPNFTAFSLLRSCTPGQVLKWDGTSWACAIDTNTTYTGTAPVTVAAGTISLANCGANQVYRMNAGGTAWSCQSDAPGGVTAVTGSAPLVSSGGATPALSLALCPANQLYMMNAGGTAWSCQPEGGAGTVTTVSGTAPIAVANGNSTPSISMTQATPTTNGWLSSTDFASFSNKGSGTVTNVTVAAPLTVTNGTSTPAISIAAASNAAGGYLTSTDWTNFNNKAPASGSPNYIANQVTTGQAGGFNLTGTGMLSRLGLGGVSPGYNLDVAANGTLTVARFGNGAAPVTVGPGASIAFNDTWSGGFATTVVAGYAANLGFDTSTGRLLFSNTAASIAANTTHGYSPFMVINGNGRPGFNIPYPYTLNNAFQVGSNTSDGNGAYLSLAGVWTNVSTRTRKTNIRPVVDALSLLEKVKVYRFRYKSPGGDDGRDHLGVIAEELPDVVASDDHRGAPTGELIGLALGANRELAAKVTELETKNARQAAQLAELMKRLEALEQAR